MAVRPVLALPDPFLQRPSAKVGDVDDRALALATDLLDTMRARPACVGLAAPQIGVGLRAFAVDVTGHRKARSCHGELVLFDPELVSAAGPEVAREGCLSIPDLTGDVARATEVVVRGTGVDGSECIVEADAFEARALLHELDHLDGFLFLDRVSSAHAVYRRKVYR
ncbi:MAG TPA: peptide deformylase [Acidimicrobiales bacterium]|nr:peptide deformylase [Acidimicrobiales bacterium]